MFDTIKGNVKCLFIVHLIVGRMRQIFIIEKQGLEAESPFVVIDSYYHLSLVVRKPVFRVSEHVQDKPCRTATEDG